MSIAKLFVKIFGEDIFDKTDTNSQEQDVEAEASCPKPQEEGALPLTEQMTKVKSWLNNKLSEIDENCLEAVITQRTQMLARLGPPHVAFDIDYSTNVRPSADRLTIRSQGTFNTVKANVCVFGGRWMYEILLHTKGVMQVGWASPTCTFCDNQGVGDSLLSYGYDGCKQQIWHISEKKYGERWEVGDIVGITIDFQRQEIEYYRNGKSMGVAFKRIETGPGIAYFPAISLSFNQSVFGNFGNMPYVYPIEGFMPMQAKPIAHVLKADLLLGYMSNLADIIARKTRKQYEQGVSTKKTVYVIFCTLLIERLTAHLFDLYVIADKLLAYIKDLCLASDVEKQAKIIPGATGSLLGGVLSILWNYLEKEEISYILKKTVNTLLIEYVQSHKGLDYQNQKTAITTLNCLCNDIKTRKFLLENKLFRKHCLALFMYIRPPRHQYLEELLPNNAAWTEGIGGPKAKYLLTVDKVLKAVEPLYLVQKAFLFTLLVNTDGTDTSPSSRKWFITKLRRYVMDLSAEQRPFHSFFFMQSSIHYPIQDQVSLSLLCILIDITRNSFEKEVNKQKPIVDCEYFFKFDYYHFDRLGGVMSHLKKVFREEVNQYLGPERIQYISDEDRPAVHLAQISDATLILNIGNRAPAPTINRIPQSVTATFTHYFNPRAQPTVQPSPSTITANESLCELLDTCVLFYYSVGHKYIMKITTARDEIAVLNEVLRETKGYRENIEKKLKIVEAHATVCLDETHCHQFADLTQKFGLRENVFAKRSIELARKQIWFRAVALGKLRRLNFVWLLESIFRTLNASSNLEALFAFVPEIYINILPIMLDTIMDFSNHELMLQFEMSDAECVIDEAAEFLSGHAADQRVVIASCKDALLQGLGTLACHRSGMRALERTPTTSQVTLINALLRPYENRAWGQSNWLLLRFWLGDGFAFRDARQPSPWLSGNEPVYNGLCRSRAKNETHTGLLHHIAPPNPSKTFQRMIGSMLTDDEPFATTFLNSVLSQLNWAFSEFILLLQEMQNLANRQENAVFEAKQLKICAMCFELTVSLLRCLEMIITVAPEIFHDASRANSDLILNRVCQLVSQVLSRVTVPPGCFQFVIDMCAAELESVSHFPIIAASLGIIVALMRQELDSELYPPKVTRISRALLTDPSFQFANLEFALDEVRTPILQQTEIPRGNFDPQQRAHIDPLTNDVRVPIPAIAKRLRASPPFIKFSLKDFPSHVKVKELEDTRKLIDVLRAKQSLLSDITLPSEDSLCPICCAKSINVVFHPCKHQSCRNCILQHLMNSKLCFYCKSLIETVTGPDGAVLYHNTEDVLPPPVYDDDF
ncbi:E3 ubiquitin-protein ligase RNF123 isoform X2 [Teleopsis dalmanni]|uniref:E3 ubiquitin-protein ligase RNF123 isoform X2 n=1 Tax=Teleopsis dalmanni TaxID=139649 RepID=UPI0018CF81C4|nr:E3 ubiquitin-protein ligase RNF123 isoform X2 [Teleopsis dalmanni]